MLRGSSSLSPGASQREQPSVVEDHKMCGIARVVLVCFLLEISDGVLFPPHIHLCRENSEKYIQPQESKQRRLIDKVLFRRWFFPETICAFASFFLLSLLSPVSIHSYHVAHLSPVQQAMCVVPRQPSAPRPPRPLPEGGFREAKGIASNSSASLSSAERRDSGSALNRRCVLAQLALIV